MLRDDRPDGQRCRPRCSLLLMSTWGDTEAEMVRQILTTHDIPCQLVSHIAFPFTVDGLGEVRILVPGPRLREARALLAEHRREGLEVLPGGKTEQSAGEPAAADLGTEGRRR